MLISRPSKALIFNLKNPDPVMNVIPGARGMDFRGRRLTVVKHGLDETKVLRNLGHDVPSPIRYYYDWSGRRVPFHAQKATAEMLSLNHRAFVLNGMGTGKTLATLWCYDYLRARKRVKKILIAAPLSTLERTWGDHVFEHFPHLSFTTIYGDRAKRLKLLNLDSDVYIINHHGLEIIVDAMKDRDDIDLIVPDELAVFRNSGTNLWRSANKIINKQIPRMAWGLTGTPTPNTPADAWAQIRLITPERVTQYFGKFRTQVMRQVGPFSWVAKDDAVETVREAMQPAVRFSLEDCADIPETVYQTRHADLTPAQRAAYKDMLTKLSTEVADGQILAVNEAVKAGKLVQIACGVAYNVGGTESVIGAEPRLRIVQEIIEESASKVIVFVPYISVIGQVAAYLEKAGFNVGVIHGGVSKFQRDEILRAFQKDLNPHVLVAQPATMSHGLTLTAASTIVWYAPIANNDTFEQACARIIRPGQLHKQLIVFIEGTPIERKWYERLQGKQKLQGTLLDLVREQSKMLTS